MAKIKPPDPLLAERGLAGTAATAPAKSKRGGKRPGAGAKPGTSGGKREGAGRPMPMQLLLPPKRGAEITEWTQAWSEMIIRYRAAGLTVAQCADLVGASEPTLRKYFSHELDYGKALVVGRVAGVLVDKALAGDNTCITFYLKTQGGFSETNRTEISGVDGMPIATAAITLDARDLNPEQRTVLRAALEAAVKGD